MFLLFGAVVDPALSGKVKITVIATGFDRKGAGRALGGSAQQTPVDLTSYTAHLNRIAEPAAAAAQPAASAMAASHMAAAGGGYSAPPLTINRRPPLDLSMAAAGSERESESPLDVPAFLRRQS